jgi:hypothetical protein
MDLLKGVDPLLKLNVVRWKLCLQLCQLAPGLT